LEVNFKYLKVVNLEQRTKLLKNKQPLNSKSHNKLYLNNNLKTNNKVKTKVKAL
jgi:hypothetical protein